MPSLFQRNLRAKILDALDKKPLKARDLATKVEENYNTVRATLKDMARDGLVKSVLVKGSSQVHWTTGIQDGQNDLIPYFNYRNQRNKITVLLDLNPSNGTRAISSLKYHVAKILRGARQANEPDYNEDQLALTMDALRVDRDALQGIIDIFNQILDNPRLWSAEFLKHMVNDEAYDEHKIITTIQDWIDAQ